MNNIQQDETVKELFLFTYYVTLTNYVFVEEG